jgi:hypothetical protein
MPFSGCLQLGLTLLALLSAVPRSGDGVYSPACSDEAGGVAVRVSDYHVEFTNNSGKTLAALKLYSQNQNYVISELNTLWTAGATFKISPAQGHASGNPLFAYRIIVVDAKHIPPRSGDPRGPCGDAAFELANQQHLALCDQIKGSPSCRYGAEEH